ncbi:fibrillin-2-like [Mya arenaria]|uniref:fibrillin-2-like n=1 Tax=Mya arenaria TaxID=6604 RepID=UPI0022E01CDD|nr:fibrillin-2-like [Mya arenaria]
MRGSQTLLFQYNKCLCNAQYTGLDCELDIDGCVGEPCSIGRNCSDVPAKCHLDDEPGFNCSRCPDGYIDDGARCQDIDECGDTNSCEQICINTEGSFICSCKSGYRVESSDLKKCVDINECDEATHNCSHICKNTNGQFQCKCHTGYKLDDTRNKCEQISNDECAPPYFGTNCEETCNCSSLGTKECHQVKGCVCENGWQGDRCDVDVNECGNYISPCSDAYQICVNIPGSFLCECLIGFKDSGSSHCEDVDECTHPLLNECGQNKLCSNTEGGYTCNCIEGFVKSDEDCIDVDECNLGTSGCQQMCENLPGHFNCYCYYGYTLDEDRKSCLEVKNPCLQLSYLNCSHYCVVEENVAECKCNFGYYIDEDSQTCKDINECDNKTLNECQPKENCINVPGSYNCECTPGYKLSNGGRQCYKCDQYHFGNNCEQTCSCLHGTCDNTQGCNCSDGWAGDQCDTDLDECDNEDLCPTNFDCVNTMGSFLCQCHTGYFRTEDRCEDINECSDVSLNKCEQACHNTGGGYECSCYNGYMLNITTGTCSDVDECQSGFHQCEQNCQNTQGGYICTCKEGLVLDLTDRRSCLAEIECESADAENCPENSICTQNITKCVCNRGFLQIATGACITEIECESAEAENCPENSICTQKITKCVCNRGFVQIATGACINVNECDYKNGYCAHTCQDNPGGYDCLCDNGFHLANDGRSCEACKKRTFGVNCSSTCICEADNTYTCDNVVGTCTCKQGWTGDDCSKDVDECHLSTHTCSENSSCRNKDGGFLCDCHTGYQKTGGSLCAKCGRNYFGESCRRRCECFEDETQFSCNHIDGRCRCKTGFHRRNESDTCKDTSFDEDCHKSIADCTVAVTLTTLLNITFDETVNLDIGSTYRQIERKLTSSLLSYMKIYTNFPVQIKICDIRKRGSLHVNYTICMNATFEEQDKLQGEAANALYEMARGDTLEFDGEMVRVSTELLVYTDDKCQFYQNLFGNCDMGYKCCVEKDRINCCEDTRNDLAIIMGSVFGGTAFLVLVVIFCVTLVTLRRKTNRKKANRYPSFTTSSQPTSNRSKDQTPSRFCEELTTNNDADGYISARISVA